MSQYSSERARALSFSTISQLSMDSQRSSLREIQLKIAQLEEALSKVNLVKSELNRNASEVKTQIHSNISRHLEALRSREVWLLSQVDLVTSAKEEVLHRQQAHLNQSLGVLQSCLPYTDAENLTDELCDDLEMKINLTDMKPEETPFVTFCGDAASLRNNIINYGRVDSNGVSLSAVFQDPAKPSASLPPHFEDYEDDDHHVLYKTVEEIKRNRTADSSVQVKIPKLSPSSDVWLAKSTVSSSSKHDPEYTFPPFSLKTKDWIKPTSYANDRTESGPWLAGQPADKTGEVTLGPPAKKSRDSLALPLVSSNASIQNWLHQIKRNPDVEDEEDFEIVDNVELSGPLDTGDSLDMILSSKQTSETARLFDSPTFKKLARTSLEVWLKETSIEVKPSTDDYQNLFCGFFRDFYKNPERWLYHSKPSKLTDGCASKEGMLRSGHHVDMSRYTRPITAELQQWLSPQSHVPDVMEVCRGDNPESLGSVVSDNLQLWVLPSRQNEGLEKMDMEIVPATAEMTDWLVKSSELPKPATRVECFSMDQFNTSHKNTNWLKTEMEPMKMTSEMPYTDLYTHCGDLTEKSHWLMQTDTIPETTTKPDPCPSWEKICRVHEQMSEESWLDVSDSAAIKVADRRTSLSFPTDGACKEKWLMSEELSSETPNHTFGPFANLNQNIGDWLQNKQFMVETV